jgi:DNA-binding PadR family transcriptional regulator
MLPSSILALAPWDTKGSGSARKVYSLTKDREHHLQQWSEVLHNVSRLMSRFRTQGGAA